MTKIENIVNVLIQTLNKAIKRTIEIKDAWFKISAQPIVLLGLYKLCWSIAGFKIYHEKFRYFPNPMIWEKRLLWWAPMWVST